jgi:Zn finger protein HypA/HybF involved in hydrogenase expression
MEDFLFCFYIFFIFSLRYERYFLKSGIYVIDMKNYLICEDCGYIFDNKQKSGDYLCPQCEEKKHFYSLTFGCGGKPSELYNNKMKNNY